MDDIICICVCVCVCVCVLCRQRQFVVNECQILLAISHNHIDGLDVMAEDAMDEMDAMHGWEGHDQVRHVGSCTSHPAKYFMKRMSSISVSFGESDRRLLEKIGFSRFGENPFSMP